MIHNFDKLKTKLVKNGFTINSRESKFQVIKGVDFEKAYRSGAIFFDTDGIYLEHQEKQYRGYMFIQEAYISYNGGPVKFPKFHLHKCKVINEFISKGTFKQRYQWSNSSLNNLLDKQSRLEYKDVKLEVCSYCERDILETIDNTEDFFNTLETEDIEEDKIIEVDIMGYVPEKERISKLYREKQNYTCEECSITPTNNFDKRWWHTHHIDGVKINNKETNLKCLCIDCHSKVDTRHKENFSKNSIAIQLKSFLEKYKSIDGNDKY